jgi:hypothetical protein
VSPIIASAKTEENDGSCQIGTGLAMIELKGVFVGKKKKKMID